MSRLVGNNYCNCLNGLPEKLIHRCPRGALNMSGRFQVANAFD